MKKLLRKVFILLILIAALTDMSLAVAESRDYIVDDGEHIPVPETYILKDIIYYLKDAADESMFLKLPEDIFINEQGYIFIADTGNNRIVKLNREGKLLAVFNEANGLPFKTPGGVFADKLGNLFIADSGNRRVVHLSATGEFVEEFVSPESELLSDTFLFEPNKICITPTGYIYVLSGKNIMMIDAFNNFRGYIGQSYIGYSITDVLIRIFASDEQKRAVMRRTPASYINMAIDEKGMIYATTMDYSIGEIKKLNSVGNNIFKQYSEVQQSASFLNLDFLTNIQLAGKAFIFGERTDEDGKAFNPVFRDITVDKNGIISVIEENTGKVYQYSDDGDLLAVFGGKSDQKSKFSRPSSLDVDNNGCVYVLDENLGNIQVFEPTEFINKIHTAITSYSNGEYDKAYSEWKEILNIHQNYPLAHLGLARSLYKQKMWKEAMEEYFQANDREGYSEAFIKYRYEIVRSKFPIILAIFISAIVVIVLLIKILGKMSAEGIEKFQSGSGKQFTILDYLKLSLGIIRHPVETFEIIKNNYDSIKTTPGFIIIAVLFLVRVFFIFYVHFPLSVIDARDTNIMLEAVKLILPVITWVVASFAVTAILDGESHFKDIFVASSFCMVPYIIINLGMAILSNVLSQGEIALFAFALNATQIWIYVLFLIQAKVLNDYTYGKAIAVSGLNVIVIALIWAIGLMAYLTTGRMLQFVTSIIREFRMISY